MIVSCYFISAGAGYRRLELVHSHAPNGEFKVRGEPIIAWELRPGGGRSDTNYFGHPVTLVWSPFRDAVIPILEPDGVVRLTNGASFASERAWLGHVKADERAAS